MIKATIQNAPYCTEIEFPCTETDLSKKLSELGMNAELLAPEGTVIAIEPAELSMLNDCLVSLDALNYLGKRMDGMDDLEKDRFFAALSCDESIGQSLKDVINLTYNLSHYTLIKDTADLERAGFVHMCNIRGALTASEFENKAWLAEEGSKLINSGKGIDTEYGKIFVNEEIKFDEVYNGTVFPVFYSNLDAVVSVEVSYLGATELVDLPNEDVAIKKALTRLGADSIEDCTLKIDSFQEIADDWWEEIKNVEQSKDIFGLNSLLKTMKGQVKFMKANVKKHVIIGTLSVVCVAMVCVIAAQFNTKLPSVDDNVTETTTEAEITVAITSKPKEEKKPIVTDSDNDTNTIIETEAATETSKIRHETFVENGGIEIDQSFTEATKLETAPPPPEITDESILTNPAEPPKYESEQVEIKPQTTEPPSDTPKHGDKKDGMIYINGFGWIVNNGGGSRSEYAEGMYENGNKIGYFG